MHRLTDTERPRGREQTEIAIRLRHDPADSQGWIRLFELTHPLVLSIAARYRMLLACKADMIDLYQAGRIGIVMAVRQFDPKRKNQFATFAHTKVRAAIQNEACRLGYLIWIPERLRLATWRGGTAPGFSAKCHDAAKAVPLREPTRLDSIAF